MKCENYCCIIVIISTVLYKSHSVVVKSNLCLGFFDAVRHASLLVSLIGTTQVLLFLAFRP